MKFKKFRILIMIIAIIFCICFLIACTASKNDSDIKSTTDLKEDSTQDSNDEIINAAIESSTSNQKILELYAGKDYTMRGGIDLGTSSFGPQGFYISDDEKTIYICDSYGKSVLKYVNGNFILKIYNEKLTDLLNIYVFSDRIYLLNDRNIVYTLDQSGNLIDELNISDTTNQYSYFYPKSNIITGYSQEKIPYIYNSETLNKNIINSLFGDIISVVNIKDIGSYHYIRVCNSKQKKDFSHEVKHTLYLFKGDSLISSVSLVEHGYSYTKNDIFITNRGKIYQMQVNEDSLCIYKLGYNNSTEKLNEFSKFNAADAD